MSKFELYLQEEQEYKDFLSEQIDRIVEENAELFEDVAGVQSALGGISVISSGAISKFTGGAKSDVEIIYMLYKNKDKFPEKTQAAITSLYKKYEKQINAFLERNKMQASASKAASRVTPDGWGRRDM